MIVGWCSSAHGSIHSHINFVVSCFPSPLVLFGRLVWPCFYVKSFCSARYTFICVLCKRPKSWFVLTGCLDPENFKEFKLVKRTELSHNVAKFKFELPAPTSVLGLPIGQHISCRFGSVPLHSTSSTFIFLNLWVPYLWIA
jgi:hypothetical protein